LPQARLAIVGRDPVRRVLDLAAPDIEITGQVDDVRPWLRRAAVVVVPLRVGGGTRLKVLEAMAMGKAVVATSMAIEGLDVATGKEVIARDDPSAQADAIVDLARDEWTRARIGTAARRRVEQSYRWEDLVPQIEQVQQQCVAGGSAKSYNS
jgi:glycosyltransferase involved in cell wall biosynthesis